MPKNVESIKHKASSRAHIPSNEEAGYEAENPHVQSGKTTLELPKNPVTHRGQDPELFWLNKYDNDDPEERLRVDIRSLYRHEHIAPEALISRLHRTVQTQPDQEGLFSVNELFGNALDKDELEKVSEYYRHRDGWTNRLIQGDSLLVMTSLLEREGMAGQVQCVYLDPPYGIKYGSNWQVRLNNRDVKDGSDDALAGEPEVIKAFRDTWELGIHSYLSYTRDRLLVARELLTESGSCFVQISDENVHLVRSVMDEVFGSENFVSLIAFRKTSNLTAEFLPTNSDFILWYGKNRESLKFRQLYTNKTYNAVSSDTFGCVEFEDGSWRRLTKDEKDSPNLIAQQGRLFGLGDLTSSHEYIRDEIKFKGKIFTPKNRYWSTSVIGLQRLIEKNRIVDVGETLRYKRYFDAN
ncbi:MAG: hypothetical protein H9535_15595 [Ignavibacteria bacterium]|nr:hypothetical protein [Ignavibacteria bacterium]